MKYITHNQPYYLNYCKMDNEVNEVTGELFIATCY